MVATVGLFLTGAFFGYWYVLPGALKILIVDFGSKFNSIITIEEYTGFFMSVILGLGISFEMPMLIFFLAMFGIVSPSFLWKNIRYAILAVFLGCGHHHAEPRPLDNVYLRHSHARALHDRDRRGLVGSSFTPQS